MNEGIDDSNLNAKARNILSAKGAKYDSQGQALSGAKRVAPGKKED